ncbi:mercury transporter [Oceanirhabdus seepicola]|uniref:Mercury transporter n=1 Tax=Oceanirhabdus seepicola TaxID=2828781 RepID=A0A9J6P3G2_9CLOT|nr:mercury transporter [Oceanirhabdus seepicola]MCM1991346.1 mercury transporter [Oceanirhabdus seepicola]
MELVKEMANAFVMLIRVGVVLRVVYCFIRMGVSEDESAMFKKRLKNSVMFYVLAESIWGIKDLVLGYYS